MANLATTYQYIADILSFEISNYELEKILSNPLFNWDNIVVEGSKHLVLPAIYCRLRSKKLTHILPNDLNTYLAEITALNRDRNLAIIEQVKGLAKLFKVHSINHVFLKGAALLVGDFYEDIAERMVGDIDVLIDEIHLQKAFDLLINEGYEPIAQTLGHDFFEHKHLPRLKTDKDICAVELHKKLFVSYQDNELRNANILAQKQVRKAICLPSLAHLMRHNVLNYQINDKGKLYNSISFRSAYDSIILSRKLSFHIDTNDDKTLENYFNILGLFFKDLKPLGSRKTFMARFYLYKLNHIKFYKSWNRLLNLTYYLRIFLGRVPFFFSNKAYRLAVLNDRRRIFKYFKSVLKNS
ncbi:nucleotidyltransferase family protein [Winogradskyella sp.]|uniref:nucleotidyltransferase family protein n=1 Tax=Winogradskyella sp. TaxID=1883156 RepID=UPI002612A3BD|nr:nucleotidyltransferase family protein [Winogradskyella sp.]